MTSKDVAQLKGEPFGLEVFRALASAAMRAVKAQAVWGMPSAIAVSIGFSASARETPGRPIVVGHDRSAQGASALFYGHYDVQPVSGPMGAQLVRPLRPEPG